MASLTFYNTQGVQNQAGTQIVNGNINFFSNDSRSGRGRSLASHPVDPDEELDDEILASLAFPQMHDRRRNIDAPHFQTCQWIFDLEQYQSWKAKPSGLLWIKGKPGAGKSTLMSQLYNAISGEHIDHRGTILEFFFNARGESLQHTIFGMLRTLLNQIFYKDRSIRDLLRKPYQERCATFGRSERAWEWQRKELESILIEIITVSSRTQQLTMFIDALDEAGEQAAREVANYFHVMNDRVVQTSGKARICMSCRHYPIASAVSSVQVNVEDHNHDDIRAYIEDCIKPYMMSDEDSNELKEWQELLKTLVTQANGIFQWAHLIVPMVNKYLLDGLSPADVSQWLHQVPEELEDVYKHILQAVIDKRYRNSSLRLFQWVCLAMRPLTVTEVRHALASHNITLYPLLKCVDTKDFVVSNEVMKSRIKSWSGGLLEILERHDLDAYYNTGVETVQVIHQSVNDFFLTQGFAFLAALDGGEQMTSTSLLTPVSELVSSYHCYLYYRCLNYIASEIPTDFFPPRAEKADGRPNMKHRSVGDIENQSPLLKYTVFNALAHAIRANKSRGLDLKQELNLLTQALPWWTESSRRMESGYPSIISVGSTALHIAAILNRVDLAQFSLDQGIALDGRNIAGRTALHLAAEHGHLDVAELLYFPDSDLDMRLPGSPTPLVAAASHGQLRLFTWLLEHNAGHKAAHQNLDSALRAAAGEGHILIVKLCVQSGADVNAQAEEDCNALQAASSGCHTEVIRFLIEHGADVNAPGTELGDALQRVLQCYDDRVEEVVRLLVEAGADVNAQAEPYGNALQAAAVRGNMEIVHLLMDAGADVKTQGGQYGNALQAASCHGHKQLVCLLLEAGVDVNAQGGQHSNALEGASTYGNIEIMRLLIQAGAHVNTEGGRIYGTPLQAASYNRHIQAVRLLIDAGADVHARGPRFGTALQAASFAHDSNEDVVRLLLEAGADVNAQGGHHGNALQAASFRGEKETVRLLIEAGANVNEQGGRYGNALRAAVSRGSIEIVHILIEAGINVNARGGIEDSTAIQLASHNGHHEVVRCLIKAGTDVNALGGKDGSALQAASSAGDDRMVRLLIAAGANLNHQGESNSNALHAASYHGYDRVVRLLTEAGADVNAYGVGEYGSALQAASSRGHDQVVQYLIKAGADVNAPGIGEGGTALQEAVSNNHDKVVQILIKAGADVNAPGGEVGGTAIQKASRKGHGEMVRLLIEADANIDITEEEEYGTALQEASCYGHAEIVSLLIAAGADVNGPGGELYDTPLLEAARQGYDEIVRLLIEAGADESILEGLSSNDDRSERTSEEEEDGENEEDDEEGEDEDEHWSDESLD